MATATGMVQLPSTSLVVPSNEYVSPFEALPWPRVETPAFVDTLAPIFEPHMPHELHAPNPVALNGLVFPQAAPLQDNTPLFVSDRFQSSTSVAEVNSLTNKEPVGLLKSPITALAAFSSQTASRSSHSPLFPSPPRAVSTPVSTPASPPVCTHMRDHQREIEGVDWKFNSSQGIDIDAGIERELRCVWFQWIGMKSLNQTCIETQRRQNWLISSMTRWRGSYDHHQKGLASLSPLSLLCHPLNQRWQIALLPTRPR